MWKKIIIGAVVLLLAASFVAYKNHEAMTMAEGEIETVQTRLRDVVSKQKNIEMDKAIQVYAEMRSEYFTEKKDQFIKEREALESEDAEVKTSISESEQRYSAAEESYRNIQEQLNAFKRDLAEAAHLEDDFDGDQIETVVQKIVELKKGNDALSYDIAQEDGAIEALGKRNDMLTAQLEAAKKLAQDRQARISPPELSCRVASVDPQWDYVILDAGVNKGIVIGSRLQAKRGDDVIAELNVTFVEANCASCEVVPESLKVGERVQPGDVVTSVRKK